ncbi:MAG: sugar phosphate nucleotidyltransferase [Chthoniobacteraceae bacterium]
MTRAFLLGAGLGTRLKTLTERRPKPLIPIFNKPLITFAFDQLIAAGVKELVINTHHCHEAYQAAFPGGAYMGARLIFEYEPVLLETAGGIKNVERHFEGQPFLVYNGDVLSNVPLKKIFAHHRAAGNEVTLVLRSRGTPLHVTLEGGRVRDIAGRLGVPGKKFLFTGIYMVEPAFLKRIPAHAKISVIPLFMDMIKEGARLGGMVLDEASWWDLGAREQYLDVHTALAGADFFGDGRNWREPIHPSAQIDPGARMVGFLSAGQGAVVESGAQLTDCILWDGARVLAGSKLDRCIVTSGQTASGTHTGVDF